MSKGLIFSLTLHCLCFALLFFGVSFWPAPELSPPLSIPMDIVNISELSVAPKAQKTVETPLPTPTPQSEPEPEPQPEPTPDPLPLPAEPQSPPPPVNEPEKVIPEPPAESIPPLPPTEPLVEPSPEPIKQSEPTPLAPPSKPQQKKKPPVETPPQKEKKKETKKTQKDTKKKKKDDPFDDVLKAVEDLKAPAERQPKNGELSDKTQVNEAAIIGEVLSISELDALRRQFSLCWSPPTGLKGAEEMIVDLSVTINPDGTVQEVKILDQDRYRRDARFQPAADAARRAVLNPACNPLRIPPHKYNLLKSFVLKFNPSEMF